MIIENFKKNYELLEIGNESELYLDIIYSDKEFKKDFKVGDFFFLLKFDSIDLSFLETVEPNDLLKEINNIFRFLQHNKEDLRRLENKYFYIVIYRIIGFNATLIESISPYNILRDLLNILALYFGTYFSIKTPMSLISNVFDFSALLLEREFQEF